MKFTIAHLYYDLLNLYGESGNIKALKQALESQGMDVEIKFFSLTDVLEFSNVQLIYIGSGTEQNQKMALKHMMKYQDVFKQARALGTFFLATGNALELFGKTIYDQNEKKWKALHFFPYTAKEEPFRIVDEALFKMNELPDYILGFQNQNSVIRDLQNPWFQVVKGTGCYPGSGVEGLHEGHFYGTYLIGPLLVRNPALLEYIVQDLLAFYYPEHVYREIPLSLERQAYQTFMENYYKEFFVA